MPYKFQTDKVPLPRNKDRRIKLNGDQRREIRESTLSQRKLAALYGVSRRLIQFVRDPQRLLDNRARREERGGWAHYYNKDKHRGSMKSHRRYKQGVLKNVTKTL